MIADRLADPELDQAEAGFLAEIGDVFSELEGRPEADLYLDGCGAPALRGATPATCPTSTP